MNAVEEALLWCATPTRRRVGAVVVRGVGLDGSNLIDPRAHITVSGPSVPPTDNDRHQQ